MYQSKEEKSINSSREITLIALIITIIVLLILAGVSISMVVGENGVLNRATDASQKTNEAKAEEQRQFAIAEAAMNFENTEYEDKNGEKVTIPAGFAVSQVEGENTVEDGLVIIDNDGNEFVWIPVETGFKRQERLSETPSWEKEEYEKMKQSVEKNGGFYIGRYEAGSTTERKGWQDDKKGNGTTKMVVQRDQYPYVFVGWGKYSEKTGDYSEDIYGSEEYETENNGVGAVYLCRHMYDGKEVGVKSTLCYRSQLDAVLEFIKKHGFNVDSDSSNWGNYYGSEFEITRLSAKKQLAFKNDGSVNGYQIWENAYGKFGSSDSSYLLTTGASDRNKTANIYDIAGNCDELTMEISEDGTSRIRSRWFTVI